MNEYQIQKLMGGFLFVILFVKILKRIIRQPRPVMNKGSTYGMPSTRAATVFFLITFIILISKLSVNTIFFLIIMATSSCILKYIMKEHSIPQLVAGALLGTVIGYMFTKF